MQSSSVMAHQSVLVTLVPKDKSASMDNESPSRDGTAKLRHVLTWCKMDQVNYIGPQVGKEMASKSALAIFFALLGTMVYIAFRFDLRFAIGSTVALIHDPIIILGIFSFLILNLI